MPIKASSMGKVSPNKSPEPHRTQGWACCIAVPPCGHADDMHARTHVHVHVRVCMCACACARVHVHVHVLYSMQHVLVLAMEVGAWSECTSTRDSSTCMYKLPGSGVTGWLREYSKGKAR